MAKLKITETVLRDAHQSLIATRMTMDEMRPMFKAIDEVGFLFRRGMGRRYLR
jgi:oxaloacetate decarboxylase alpha subunit